MQRELPLYIFIRNSIMLCIGFFIISSVIIERGRLERGENTLFNAVIIKKSKQNVSENNIHANSKKHIEIYDQSSSLIATDSIQIPENKSPFLSTLVDNRNLFIEVSNQVDL